MLCTLRDIEQSVGHEKHANELNKEARQLLDLIEDDRQKVRVMSDVGFFEYDHQLEKYWARGLILGALELADRVSPDQAEKIRAEWDRRCGF
ncbi:hypothetical protein KW784_02110 [Candidatus Parcubacteria bacterium]|nr:hypothetical protein [Candidatus Parcubacteria bacterium]